MGRCCDADEGVVGNTTGAADPSIADYRVSIPWEWENATTPVSGW